MIGFVQIFLNKDTFVGFLNVTVSKSHILSQNLNLKVFIYNFKTIENPHSLWLSYPFWQLGCQQLPARILTPHLVWMMVSLLVLASASLSNSSSVRYAICVLCCAAAGGSRDSCTWAGWSVKSSSPKAPTKITAWALTRSCLSARKASSESISSCVKLLKPAWVFVIAVMRLRLPL